jgi:hypothetical protein
MRTLLILLFVYPSTLLADEFPYKLNTALSFASHKEQVKTRGGTASGPLVSNSQLALTASITRALSEIFDAGVFVVGEWGSRTLAPYSGLGPSGEPLAGDRQGGHYQTLWLGPMARANWNRFFFDVGYVLLGLRWDEFYDDLASTGGDTSSAFQSNLGRAWIFGLGGTIPLAGALEATLRIEYRYHYYSGRGGEPLADDLMLGSQAIRPHLGVQYRF